MRCRLPSFVLLCIMLALSNLGCAGCSEECSGARQGSEGCPCQSDQDCTTVGAVLLCTDGACAAGDPPDARGATDCEGDTDCQDGEACAADGSCQPAPSCQRLEPAGALATRALPQPSLLVVSTAAVSSAEVAGAPRSDCGVAIVVDDPPLTVEGFFTRDGRLDADACGGRWYAAERAGFVECSSTVVALSDPTVTTCLGRDCDAPGCRVLGDGEMGVCP